MANHKSAVPAEIVLTGGAVGLEQAGITRDMYIPEAPIAGCRLCGKVYQTKFHRQLHNDRVNGIKDEDNGKLLQLVLDLNMIWREEHTRKEHTQDEINELEKSGAAFTPLAANRLSPFGVIPLGNMSQEIADAMFEAPRKPDMTLLEGGE